MTQVLPCDSTSISFPPSSDLPTISSKETLTALTTAARELTHFRQPVAFPTETVYGLGAVASDEDAVSRIFSTKGRPPDNPLIVHVSSAAMLRTLVPVGYTPSHAYKVLMDRFWPGPLTLILPRNPAVVPDIVSAKHPTVAVRMPSHPVARALIALADAPLAAPSANSSGSPSPTRAGHVLRDLNGRIGLILDGGPCAVGLESTVIDGLNEDGDIRVLRPGGVTVEDIQEALTQCVEEGKPTPKVLVHRRDYQDEQVEQAPTTPGMKYRHYSPSVPVFLLCTSSPPPRIAVTSSFRSLVTEIMSARPHCKKIGILSPSDSALFSSAPPIEGLEWHHFSLGPTSEPSVIAHRLFDGLLTLEEEGVHLIFVEEIKEEMEGLAVMNRIRKAAHETRWVSVP